MHNLSKPLTVVLCTTILLMVSGCDQIKSFYDGDEKKEAYKTSVEYPKTPSLEAGISISRSLALASEKQAVTLTPAEANKTIDRTKEIVYPNKNSLVLNTNIKAGTPIAALKADMDILYKGNIKETIKYHHAKRDLTNELIQTQKAVKESIKSVKYTNTKYSEDKTEAQVTGELVGKGSNKINTIKISLKKFDGKWKIVDPKKPS